MGAPREADPRIPWRCLELDAAQHLLAHVAVPWWIAGGWAIDLFLGRSSRAHEDLDVGVLYRDCRALLSALEGWQIFEAKDGVLTRLPRDTLPRSDVHSLWCRPSADEPWTLEVMLDVADGDDWLYRREPTIRRPLTTIADRHSSGLSYLKPEIQLLYKSKRSRDRDHADFEQTIGRLGPEARAWLRAALTKTEPAHAWLARMVL